MAPADCVQLLGSTAHPEEASECYTAVWEQLAILARSTMYDPANLRMSGAYWPLTTACFLVSLLNHERHVFVSLIGGWPPESFIHPSGFPPEIYQADLLCMLCYLQLRLQVARDGWLGDSSKNKSHRRFFRQVHIVLGPQPVCLCLFAW
jgi:hypothetical protein